MATNQAELLAIEGPVEVVDVLTGEIGNLASLRAIEWLHPEIVDAGGANRIHHSLSIRRKADRAATRPLEDKFSRCLAWLKRDQSEFFDVLAQVAETGTGNGPGIGRNIVTVGYKLGRKANGIAAINGDLHQLTAARRIFIHHPATVRRAHGKVLDLAEGKLLEVAAGGIHTPYVEGVSAGA